MPGNVAEDLDPSLAEACAALPDETPDLPPAVRSRRALEELLARYYAHTPAEDLEARSAAEICDALLSHLRTAARRPAGVTTVTVGSTA